MECLLVPVNVNAINRLDRARSKELSVGVARDSPFLPEVTQPSRFILLPEQPPRPLAATGL